MENVLLEEMSMPRARNHDYLTTSGIGRFMRRPILQLTMILILAFIIGLIAVSASGKMPV